MPGSPKKQTASAGKTPNDWDLYPNVYREFKDGADIHVPTEAEKAEIDRDHVPAEGVVNPLVDEKESDVHPQLWKDEHNGN